MSAFVSEIVIYPIKGLKGMSLEQSFLEPEGLQHDRRFMLVNEKNQFISQRSHAALSQIKALFSDKENLQLGFGGERIEFNINERLLELFPCTIWESEVACVEVSKEVNSWFSDLLKERIKLVALQDSKGRIKKYSNRKGSTTVSFADGYPVLLLGSASMDLLNSKLDEQVKANRFRANILLQTETPHIEDTWSKITLGESTLEIIKPCARCQVVNINQSNGISSKEPLKTLATYRAIENKIYFGANASCLQTGLIKLGDHIATATTD